MLFLNFVDEFLAALGDILWKVISSIFNLLWLVLCQIVYPLISWMFNVFVDIINVEGLSNSDISAITNRIILVLTIVMTFYIVFEFVKYTVSPDTISDKEKGAFPLFTRIIIAVLLIAFVPTIFEKASDLQFRVINSNLIGKVILGVDRGTASISNLGKDFTGDLYGSFIRVDCSGFGSTSSYCEGLKQSVRNSINEVKNTNTFFTGAAVQFAPGVEFSGLLALIFGCFVLYVLFLYCKDVALRQIQLMFLQIISPIAILSYISPKRDGMFQKWVKQCTTTYIDVFLRLALLYFMFLMCDVLGDKLGVGGVRVASAGSTTQEAKITTYLFLVAGLMLFMKKVPKLLGELFPSSGAASIGYGLSAKDRRSGFFKGAKQTVARTAGAIAGIARTGKAMKNGTLLSDAAKADKSKWARLKRGGTYLNTMGRSAYRGFEAGKDGKIGDAIKTSQESVQKYEAIVAKGGTVLGHDYRPGKYQDEQVGLQVKLDLLKQMSESKSSVNSAISEIKYRKQMESIGATIQARGDTAAKIEWDGRIKEFEKYARNYADGSITKVEYETKVQDMIRAFNSTHYSGAKAGDAVVIDIGALETDKTDIYGAITTRMKDAKAVAKAITEQKITYNVVKEVNGVRTVVQEQLVMPEMNDLGQIIDKDGNPTGKTFADYIGDFTDAANTAKIDIESSPETKKIMTNAEGKK